MSYYDPLAPSFATSRIQIQKSIMNLEQRLLRRREIDLRIQKQLLEQENMHKRQKFSSTKNLFRVEKQLEDRLRLLKGRDYGESVARDMQKQQLELDYIARLKALDRQQEIISQQTTLRRQNQLLSTIDIFNQSDQFYPLDQSCEMLARKYLNGTRALQFSQELKKADTYSDRKVVVSKGKREPSRYQQPDHSTVKKYMSSSIKKDYNDEGSSFRANFIDPSPIKLIENSSSRFNSTTSKAQQLEKLNSEVSDLKKEYAHDLRRIEEGESLDESTILQPKGTKRQMSKSTQPTTQLLRVPSSFESKQHQSSSRPQSSKKNINQLSIRQQSSKSLRYPQTSSHPLITSQPIQQRVNKQIQNRAQISQGVKQVLDIFYVKDISGYLMTVCEKENKFRKQLKEKICKIPSVQRKFDVGAVLE